MFSSELESPAPSQGLNLTAEHMALDELLLLQSPDNCLFLRLYDWSSKGCTFGYGQSYLTARHECDKRHWHNVQPVRRSTGGGIVFHGLDLTFSLVFSWDRLSAAELIYKNIHRGIHLALKKSGISSSLWSPVKRPLGAASSCFLRAEPMDLVDNWDHKVLGGALRKKGNKGLYQGSFQYLDLSLSLMQAKEIVREGISIEFGRPAVEQYPIEWTHKLQDIVKRYSSRQWNERR